MSNVAAFTPRQGGPYPDAPAVAPTFERDLQLSLLVEPIAQAMHTAAALQAGIPVRDFNTLPERARQHFRNVAEQAIRAQDHTAHRRALVAAEQHFRAGRISFEEAVNFYHSALNTARE